jgi:hypothetical protein
MIESVQTVRSVAYVLTMVLLATIVAAAVAPAAPGSEAESRLLWQGPELAGGSLVWTEAVGGAGSLHRWAPRRGERVVYRSGSLSLGRRLAASPTLVAFARGYPSCAPEPGVVCPQAEDVLVGPPAGPFRTLVRARTCSLPTAGRAFALDDGVAAYLELDCARDRIRVVVRDVARRGRPIVLHEGAVSSGCCRDVAIAGRYVAWSDRGDVVIYDWPARRLGYRARLRRDGIDVDVGFDLQLDGKLAVAYRPVEFGRTGPRTVAWFSRSEPRAHLLPLRGRSTRVRIAGDRIALERYVTATTSALVVADLAARTRTVARFAPPVRLRGGFDFDGRRIAWASDRVTATREDCPPPGQGRPCILRETGTTSVWLRPRLGAVPRRVARLSFDDQPPPQQE